jgi:phage-related protein
MKWQVNYFTSQNGIQPVREWIDSLDLKLQLKIFRAFELLEDFNINLREPYVKPLGDKLYELRIKDNKGIYRIIYFTHINKQFIMLNGFMKKIDKTPKKELNLAKNRMIEVLNNE